MPLYIPLPDDSVFVDFVPYIPLLTSAVEGFLDDPGVWEPGDYDTARLFMEDLKWWLLELEVYLSGQVRISTDDTTPGYLEDKLLAGANITLTKNSPGDNESLTIAASGSGGAAVYPKRATMWHKDSLPLSGSAIGLLANTGQFTALLFRQSPSVNGDSWTNGFFLAAGSYTLHFLAAKSNGAGKLDVSVDGTYWDTLDFYNASTTLNQDFSGALTVAADGWHVVEGTVNGKHASSSGYVINLTCISVIPTAD